MVDHNEIVNYLIKRQKDKINVELEITDIKTEQHYNHYGDRGVIDLVVIRDPRDKKKKGSVSCIEVKSHLDSADEIIRQINRSKEYFPRDKDNICYFRIVRFFLAVLANEHNYKHMEKYSQQYLNSGFTTFFVHPNKGGDDRIFYKVIQNHLNSDDDRTWYYDENQEVFNELGIDRSEF